MFRTLTFMALKRRLIGNGWELFECFFCEKLLLVSTFVAGRSVDTDETKDSLSLGW